MISVYQLIAIIIFYSGMLLWVKGGRWYVSLPAVVCSMLAFEYLLGLFA